MKPLKKESLKDSTFPLHLVYKDTKSPTKELPQHIHDSYEIVYVHEGKGTFFIDHKFYDMKKGDLFLLPSNTIHHAVPDDENPVTSSVFFFRPLLLSNETFGESFSYMGIFDRVSYEREYRFFVPEEKHLWIEEIISTFKEEVEHKNIGYKQAMLLQLQHLLLLLSRTVCKMTKQTYLRGTNYFWLQEILLYIDNHYTEGITLQSISHYAKVSSAHISRVFKKNTGLTVSEYIITKKILYATTLLVQTNLNIQEVAGKAGFNSLPYFYRTFKLYMTRTPSSYRK